MLFTEKYDLPDGGIHEGRAERAGKAAPLGLYEIDVRLAVDLRPAEEEDVDPALPREVEQLARALGERVALTLLQHGNSQGRIFLFQKKSAASGNRGGRADGDVARVADQARNRAGKQLLEGEIHTTAIL